MQNRDLQTMSFEHLFIDKRGNACGLQLADLVARPLALKYLRPEQTNRALAIISSKLLHYKVFPKE